MIPVGISDAHIPTVMRIHVQIAMFQANQGVDMVERYRRSYNDYLTGIGDRVRFSVYGENHTGKVTGMGSGGNYHEIRSDRDGCKYMAYAHEIEKIFDDDDDYYNDWE